MSIGMTDYKKNDAPECIAEDAVPKTPLFPGKSTVISVSTSFLCCGHWSWFKACVHSRFTAEGSRMSDVQPTKITAVSFS